MHMAGGAVTRSGPRCDAVRHLAKAAGRCGLAAQSMPAPAPITMATTSAVIARACHGRMGRGASGDACRDGWTRRLDTVPNLAIVDTRCGALIEESAPRGRPPGP